MVRFGLYHRTGSEGFPAQGGDGVQPVPRLFTQPSTSSMNTTTTMASKHTPPSPIMPPLNPRRKRHPFPASPSLPYLPSRRMSHAASDSSTDEHGAVLRTYESLKVVTNKSLPPTPPSSDDGTYVSPTPSNGLRRTHIAPQSLLGGSVSMDGHIDRMRAVAPTAGVVLAQAALGVGLPHVIPRSSVSSSASDGHIRAERCPPDILTLSSRDGPSVRRVKSLRRFTPKPSPDVRTPAGTDMRQASVFVQGSSSDNNKPDAKQARRPKTQEQQRDPQSPNDTSPRQGLTRRASFWRRNRHDSHKDLTTETKELAPEDTLLTALPCLPPFSPFGFDTQMPHPSATLPSKSAISASLTQSPQVSDEQSVANTPSSLSLNGSSQRKSAHGRPSTANGALERPRARSLYTDSAASPAKDPILSQHALPPPKKIPPPIPDEPPQRQNAPLLRRLSVNLFSFGSTTPGPSPTADRPMGTSLAQSPAMSSFSHTSISRKSSLPPKPNIGEETPEEYIDRLVDAVPKADVASILASSNDSFYAQALRAYIDRFQFANDSLDVAVRRLLMDVGLPRETQQIDRVMEAFAARYYQDHKDLFVSEDHPYILAFSLIMLHTDAFNKHNKRKMTKADYVKNASLPGVRKEVLECFYDNIVFAPFIFIEDPDDHHGSSTELSSRFLPGFSVSNGVSTPMGNGNSLSIIGKNNKVDPYYLITKDLLHPLRVQNSASFQDSFSYYGTRNSFNEEELHLAFCKAAVIDVTVDTRQVSSTLFSFSATNFSYPYSQEVIADRPSQPRDVIVLKVVNVGLLHRRELILEGGKRAPARKWRDWSVILTASQLLFFRDPIWAIHLNKQIALGVSQLSMPPSLSLRPDDVLSVKEAVAIYDTTCREPENTFMLVMGNQRQLLLRATDELDMNQWISRINYASAFKSNGVQMRPMSLSGRDVQLMGVAAAKSHLRELRNRASHEEPSPRTRNWNDRSSGKFTQSLTTLLPSLPSSPSDARHHSLETPNGRPKTIHHEAPTAPMVDGAQQFKATYDQVKADLAAGRMAPVDDSAPRPRAMSLESAMQPWSSPNEVDEDKGTSRVSVMRSKIQSLDSRVEPLRSELDTDLRAARNIALLTPFQRATRERLRVTLERVTKRIRQHRLRLAYLCCQRELLADDLSAEVRDWHRAKSLALRAATDVLRPHRDRGAPQTLSPVEMDETVGVRSRPPHGPVVTYSVPGSRQELSSPDSFHSALDFEWTTAPTTTNGSHGPTDGHSFEDGSGSVNESLLSTPVTEEGRVGSSSSFFTSSGSIATARSATREDPRRSLERSRRLSSDVGGYEAQPEEEEAEEWNKTRAAKRVSLVQVPSDLRLTRTHTCSPAGLNSVQSDGRFVPDDE